MIYSWPTNLPPKGLAFNRRGGSLIGPPTLAAAGEVTNYDFGFWICQFDLATLNRGLQITTWRALAAKLAGGAHQAKVPVYDSAADDNGQIPFALAGGNAANLNAEEPFSDDLMFSDDHGFWSPAIKVALAAAASARATQIFATVTTAGPILEGQYFSIGDRLYVIQEVLASAGSARTLAIWPGLREDAPLGAQMNFEEPVCRMRLASEKEMDLALGRRWMASPTVNFVEDYRST